MSTGADPDQQFFAVDAESWCCYRHLVNEFSERWFIPDPFKISGLKVSVDQHRWRPSEFRLSKVRVKYSPRRYWHPWLQYAALPSIG
jgi:hypothetical protein